MFVILCLVDISLLPLKSKIVFSRCWRHHVLWSNLPNNQRKYINEKCPWTVFNSTLFSNDLIGLKKIFIHSQLEIYFLCELDKEFLFVCVLSKSMDLDLHNRKSNAMVVCLKHILVKTVSLHQHNLMKFFNEKNKIKNEFEFAFLLIHKSFTLVGF